MRVSDDNKINEYIEFSFPKNWPFISFIFAGHFAISSITWYAFACIIPGVQRPFTHIALDTKLHTHTHSQKSQTISSVVFLVPKRFKSLRSLSHNFEENRKRNPFSGCTSWIFVSFVIYTTSMKTIKINHRTKSTLTYRPACSQINKILKKGKKVEKIN